MKEIRCTRCGSSDLCLKEGLFVCNSCNAVFLPDENEKNAVEEAAIYRDGLNKKARKLLDRIYHDTVDQKKALKLAENAVDEAPDSVEAHWVMMQVLEYQFNNTTFYEHNAWRMVSEGRIVISLAKNLGASEYEDYRHDVNELLLSTAVKLMEKTVESTEDISDLNDNQRLYSGLAWHDPNDTLETFLESMDGYWKELFNACYPAARKLIHAVEDEVLQENAEFQKYLEQYVDYLNRETSGAQRRMRRYGKALSQEQREDRENEISFEQSRISK